MFRSWTARVAALKAARKVDGDFSIVAPGTQVQKLFRLTAVDRVFRIFETREEALRQLKPSSPYCLELFGDWQLDIRAWDDQDRAKILPYDLDHDLAAVIW
jgi:hypothetical protein